MKSSPKKLKTEDGLTQSINDDRKYWYITLGNGLRALLISDLKDGEDFVEEEMESDGEASDDNEDGPVDMVDDNNDDCSEDEDEEPEKTERKSAAALCIGVGSFLDPDNIPGFAHFLEHMVFMGSSKYPGENELDEFISTHGGETNAWTDMERTCFYFGVEQKYFYRALDRFANFFISPLFKEDTVDREINAVDSEFQMNLTEDDNRVSQVVALLAKENHVMGKFTLGNAETLRDTPKREGLNIYSKLKDFYTRLYSAHYMTLAVCSKDTLDRMEMHVRDIFSQVPMNNMTKPDFDHLKEPFEYNSFHKVIRAVPVKNIHKMWISWPCPPVLQRYRTKPLDILDCLITHEGKGSILSLLKKKTWAIELEGNMSYNGFDCNTTWSWFLISIQLTPEGLEHYKEVAKIVFEYLQMLKTNFPKLEGFYKEQQEIAKTNFRWKEKIDPVEYVELVSENMQIFAKEDVLTGRSQFYQYDEQMVKSFLDFLTPERCNIVLMAKEFESACTNEERFYHVKYSIDDFDNDLMTLIQNPENNTELCFPDPNQYIATDFDIKVIGENHLAKYPVLLKEDDFVKVWYKKDTKFNIPKGFIYIHLMSPVAYNTVENAAMLDIYVNLLTQTLNEIAYPAIMANYEFSIYGHKTGMEILLDGFSHKLPELLKTVLHQVFNLTTTVEFYRAICIELKKSYHNDMLKTDELCRFLRFAVLEPVQWTFSEKSSCVDKLMNDFTKFKNFVKEFQSKLFMETYVTGNFTPEEASEYGTMMRSYMCGSPVPHEQQFKKLVRKVPKSSHYCQHYSHNEGDANSTITVYLQSEPGTFYTSCLNQLLQFKIKEPCFDILRTKLQLGYEVYSQNLVTHGILGFSILVEFQAHKFSMHEVDQHISKFLEDFKTTFDTMTQAEFESLVSSLIITKQTEDFNLEEEATRYWREIFDQRYVFDIIEKEISTLKTVTLESLKSWYGQYLQPECRRTSFQILGYKDKTEAKELPCVQDSLKSKGFLCVKDENFKDVIQIEDIESSVVNWTIHPLTKITS